MTRDCRTDLATHGGRMGDGGSRRNAQRAQRSAARWLVIGAFVPVVFGVAFPVPWSGEGAGSAAAVAPDASSSPAPVAPALPGVVRYGPLEPAEGSRFTVIVEGGEPAAVAATGSFADQPLH